MAFRVLVSSLHMRSVIERFRPLIREQAIELILPEGSQYIEESRMLELVDETIDAIICSDDHITARVIEKATRLKVISKWGVGTDSIDHTAAKARGIRVFNSPGAFNDAVADIVLCAALHFARRPDQTHTSILQGQWRKRTGRSLREQTLGIIGVGNIGREVAQRAAAFGMTLLGCDPVMPPAEWLERVPIRMVPLETLLRQSDVVSTNCSLNPSTHHLINAQTLSQMKKSAVLINTARGPVVDQAALTEALLKGSLSGAYLDVFENEPLPPESPLRTLDNVLLAPHNAYNTAAAVDFVHENTFMNCLRGLQAYAANASGVTA